MRGRRLSSTIVSGALILFGPNIANARSGDDVVALTRRFLDAYARGDRDAVLGQIDPDISIYGSDVAEVFKGPLGVGRMLDDDQKLWGGPARIGAMQQLSVVSSGDLSTLTFQAPFTLGSRPAITVRFSMVWRRGTYGWLLAQSANSVPTVGQSAEALMETGH